MKLSSFEAGVIAEISLKGDAPVEHIAKLLKAQSHRVRYTVQKLTERNIIRKAWVIDITQLGYSRFTLLFALITKTTEEKNRFLTSLEQDSRVAFLAEISGDYNYELSIVAKDIVEARHILDNISQQKGVRLIGKTISCRVRGALFSRRYLMETTPQKQRASVWSYGGPKKDKFSSFDALDLKVLSMLSKKADLSVRKVAEALKLPYSTVDVRVNKLRERGIIVQQIYAINFEHYQAKFFSLFISSNEFDKHLTEAIFEFARSSPWCMHCIECLGEWDYELGVEVSEYEEFAAFRESLMQKFHARIFSMKVIPRIRVLKFVPFPL